MPYHRIIWNDFDAGLDTTSGKGKAIASACRDNLNLLVDRGMLRMINPPIRILDNLSSPLETHITGFTRYVGSTGRYLIISVYEDGFPQSVYRIDEETGTLLDLNAIDLSAEAKPTIVQYGETIYLSDEGAALQLWTGTGSIVEAGMPAPTDAPTITNFAPGDLDNSTTGIPFRYYYTTFNDRGIESNPSPVSNSLDVVNRTIRVAIPTQSNDPSHIGIYREGAGLESPYRVDKVVYPGLGFNYDDSTPDIEVSDAGIQIETDHNPPPGGFSVMALHQGRIFGAGTNLSLIGSRSRLWYSSRGNPEYFPVDSDLGGDAGGYIDDYAPDDAITFLSSTGSLLVVGREKSLYLLYGNRFENFKYILHANIGAAGPRAGCRVENTCTFLARDKMVYTIENNGLDPIGRQIESRLLAINDTRLASACTAYHENRFFLFFPHTDTEDAIGFVYDFRAKAWTDLSDNIHSVSEVKSLPPADGIGANELIGSTSEGYEGFNGILHMLPYEATPDTTMGLRLLTSEQNTELPYHRKRAASIKVHGKVSGAVDLAATVITTSTRNGQKTQEFPIVDGEDIILNERLGAHLVGEYLQVEIEGEAEELEIYSIELQFSSLDSVV